MEKKQWFENESFWLNYAPIMFDEAHWAEARGIAESCCKIAGLQKGSRVLDACCALGRISVELALCGMDVTGVDITQPFLEAARETAQDEGVSIELVKADLRNFSVAEEKKFDAAVNIYNSFGYCNTIEEDMQIASNICSSLKKGGTFILECISRETAVRWFTEGEWFERAGKTVLTKFTVEGAWEGLRSKWILLGKDGSRMEHEFVQRLYSAPELRDMLLEKGFSSAEVYGGFDLSPYDYNAKTMVIVAKK
ncbi:MAG: class I SAM-dependent methyltransferase [Treponema sp.]|nr:class I SAM-dependent methyltransferase [Treponema sp.]MBR4386453.1 class I SAM-dependent methyltransferase [Treponema sp.]